MKAEIIEKVTTMMTTSFGFVVALAWNEAIKSLIARFHLDAHGPWIYAVFVTMLAIFAAKWLSGLAERAKKAEEKANRGKKGGKK